MVTQTKTSADQLGRKVRVKIMTLKAFQKVNSSIRTVYSVSSEENDERIECFEVNYLEPDNDLLSNMIRKRNEYEKMTAKIDMVTTSTIDPGILMVFLKVKGV